MKENYDYIRFPVKGSSDFWQVIRADNHSYNVYNLNVDKFPDLVTIYRYLIDLDKYTQEDLDEYVSTWGYPSLNAFVDYMNNETEVENHELRLCTCIIENNTTMEPEIAFEGNFVDANGYILSVIPSEIETEDHERLHC